MDHQRKLDFVLKMTKHALASIPHYELGGPVNMGSTDPRPIFNNPAPAPAAAAPAPVATALGGPTTAGTNNAAAPGKSGIAGPISDVLGTADNFQATGAAIQGGTNQAQLNNAYSGTQGALNQVGGLSNTLVPTAQTGVNSQNLLTNQLTQRSQGLGPNPAQNALNQSTGQNISQAAALAAGTRGAGTNAGLVANNAANTGAATNQTAIGQAATLQAQQQIAAQNQLQGLAGDQVSQATDATQLNNQANQNEQNILQGANTATNNAQVSSQQNINNVNAATAAANQNANQNLLTGIGQGINSVGSLFSGGLGAVGSIFAQGGEVYPPGFHELAMVYHPKHYGKGGRVWQNSSPVSSEISGGPAAYLPQFQQVDWGKKKDPVDPGTAPGTNPTGADGGYGLGGAAMNQDLGAQNPYGAAPLTSDSLQMPTLGAGLNSVAPGPSLGYADGGDVQAPSSYQNDTPPSTSISGGAPVSLPQYTPPQSSSGGGGGIAGLASLAALAARGGKIPGKPKVNHDAYKNDTTLALLTPGEVVMDLRTLHDKGKLGQMARFVAANIARRNAGRAL